MRASGICPNDLAGIDLARIAALPSQVLERAECVADGLKSNQEQGEPHPVVLKDSDPVAHSQECTLWARNRPKTQDPSRGKSSAPLLKIAALKMSSAPRPPQTAPSQQLIIGERSRQPPGSTTK